MLFLGIQNGVKMAEWQLKVNVNDSHFQYHPRESQDACLVQISDSS